MRILTLTIKRKWFDMIVSGTKREEYREIKPHWNRILRLHQYDAVRFRNGYRKDSPTAIFRLNGMMKGLGIIAWGAPEAQRVYILKLGERIHEA